MPFCPLAAPCQASRRGWHQANSEDAEARFHVFEDRARSFFPGNMWVFFSCTTLSVRAVQASLDLTSLRNEKILTKTGSSAILAVIETMQLGSEHECPIKRSIPSRQHSEFTKRGGGGAGKEWNIRKDIRKRGKPVGNRNNLSNSQGNNQLFGLEAVPQESAQY